MLERCKSPSLFGLTDFHRCCQANVWKPRANLCRPGLPGRWQVMVTDGEVDGDGQKHHWPSLFDGWGSGFPGCPGCSSCSFLTASLPGKEEKEAGGGGRVETNLPHMLGHDLVIAVRTAAIEDSHSHGLWSPCVVPQKSMLVSRYQVSMAGQPWWSNLVGTGCIGLVFSQLANSYEIAKHHATVKMKHIFLWWPFPGGVLTHIGLCCATMSNQDQSVVHQYSLACSTLSWHIHGL